MFFLLLSTEEACLQFLNKQTKKKIILQIWTIKCVEVRITGY